MNWRDHIHSVPDIMMGKLVFKGTRLTVEHVMEDLSAGMSEADLLRSYPRLRPEHILAAHAYAPDFFRSINPTSLL